MEINKETIEKLVDEKFPYETFNPGQREAIISAVEGFVLEGFRHVIIDAPTGTGKSVIAFTVHKVMGALYDEPDLDHDGGENPPKKFRTTITCPTHNLQEQYRRDFKEIWDLKGKKNYPCPKGADFYNSGPCRLLLSRGGCDAKKECPYVTRRTVWGQHLFRMTNTSFQIEACDIVCNKPWNRPNLIVIDECHKLEDMLIEHCTVRLSANDLSVLRNSPYSEIYETSKMIINMFNRIPHGRLVTISKINGFLNELKKFDFSNRIKNALSEIREDIFDCKVDSERSKLFYWYENLEQMQDKVILLESGDLNNIIVNEYEHGKLAVIKPVFASEVSYYGMFRKSQYFLHMSATITGIDEYVRLLRIGKNSYKAIEVDNPIPVENREVFLLNDLKVSGGSVPEEIYQTIDFLLDLHKGENGLIHTVSFKLAESIVENCDSDRLFVSSDVSEILKKLRENKGMVVVSPSLEEGIDLHGDLSRFQILVKAPYMFLGDPLISYKAGVDPVWYNRKALIRMIQSCGRSVRGVDDYASTYILDSSAVRILKKSRGTYLPEWFDSAVREVSIGGKYFREHVEGRMK